MRILHVFDHSLPHQSGYTYRSLNVMEAQRRAGFEVFPLTGPRQGFGNKASEDIDGMMYFRTPDRKGSFNGAVREVIRTHDLAVRIKDIIEYIKPNLIHVHSPVLSALPLLWISRKYQIPWLYEIRATWEDAAVSHGTITRGGQKYKLVRGAETLVFRKCSHIVAISEGLRADITSRGIPSTKVSLVRNMIRETPVNTHKDCETGENGVIRIGYIGSFYKYEGIDILLKLATLESIEGNNIEIYLIGGGPEEENLIHLSNKLNVNKQVSFIGRIPNSEVASWYDYIDLLVLPRRSERLTEIVTPLKPIEAMAAGCIVAASRIGGHMEVITDSRTGYLFEPENLNDLAGVVAKAVKQRRRWPEIRKNALREVRMRHSVEGAAKIYSDIFYNCIRSCGKAKVSGWDN